MTRTNTASLRVDIEPSVGPDGRPECEICHGKRGPLDPDAPGTLILAVGWLMNRAGGGAHGVTDRRDLGRFRHKACHQFGEQEPLFGDG
jgi:hypothetical protein